MTAGDPPDPDTRRARHVPALRTEGEDGVSGMSESRTRDGMDPFTRAVSDALDGYLCRMGWNVSHTNPTWLAEELAEVGVELVWKRDREQEWANGYGQGRDDEANGLPLRMTAAPTGPEPRTDAAVGR